MFSSLFTFKVWQAFKLAICGTCAGQSLFGPVVLFLLLVIAVIFAVIMLSISPLTHELYN